MADVLVTEHEDITTVSVRAGRKAWFKATPYLLFLCAAFCLFIAGLFGLLRSNPVDSFGHFSNVILLLLVTQQLALALSGLRARSTLTLQGNTIRVVTGSLFRQEDRGTYNARVLSVPYYERGSARGFFPQGKVETKVGSVALVLASQIDDAGGAHLIAALTCTLVFSSSVLDTVART